jgi:tetratricopeptide (TPR) repeat protein
MIRMTIGIISIQLFLINFCLAGIEIPSDPVQPLPARIRGFLLQHRQFRQLTLDSRASLIESALQIRYRNECRKLEETQRRDPTNQVSTMALAEYYLRFHEPQKAMNLLLPLSRRDARNAIVLSRICSGWFLLGDYRSAAEASRDLLKLLPDAQKPLEVLHQKLIISRQRQTGETGLDDLFDITWTNEKGSISPGTIASEQRKRINSETLGHLQQLCLWYPRDGRLLWQLGEHCNALGDVRSAAAILEGCVVEFGMRNPDLLERRKVYREEVERLDRLPEEEHRKLKIDIQFRSNRPYQPKLDPSQLPVIEDGKTTLVPWLVFTETTMGKGFKPQFLDFTNQLDGKRIAISGFVSATQRDSETECLLTEYPIGCWFCESPGPEQLIQVILTETPKDGLPRNQTKVEGTLRLNRKNPEGFLFVLEDAMIKAID